MKILFIIPFPLKEGSPLDRLILCLKGRGVSCDVRPFRGWLARLRDFRDGFRTSRVVIQEEMLPGTLPVLEWLWSKCRKKLFLFLETESGHRAVSLKRARLAKLSDAVLVSRPGLFGTGRKRVFLLEEEPISLEALVERLFFDHSPKKRLFHVITDLDIGGTPILLHGLLTHLDKNKYEGVVCSLKRKGDFSVSEDIERLGIPVYFLNAERLLIFQTLYRLHLLMKDERPELVHTWLFHANLFGRLAGWMTGVRAVISSELAMDPEKGKVRVFLDRLTLGLAKKIIVNAEAVQGNIQKRERVPGEKIRLIRTSVDLHRFSENGQDGRRESESETTPLLLVVARLHAAKGHKTLLEALPEILKRFPQVKVFFAGDGPLRHSLESWTKAHHMEEFVSFLGIRRDIPSLLRASRLFVLPSYEEGMPAALLEAMACGKPIVATRVGGVPEVVVEGETGLLVPPGEAKSLAEAVIDLLDHPEKAVVFGRKGRERVEQHFDIRNRASELVRLYEEVCGENTGGERAC